MSTSRRAKKPQPDPCLAPIDAFVGARDLPGPGDRLAEVRRRARGFRESMLEAPRVRFLRSFKLIRVPYPTRFGLREASTVRSPLLHLVNRLFVVQVDSVDGVKTVLVSPSDVDANGETPFFKRLADKMAKMGPLRGAVDRVIAPRYGEVLGCLAECGLRPEDVDYITYDHLHTQDVRGWLGTEGRPGIFPNAKLLIMRQEWESSLALLPTQRDWYCPGGIAGLDPARVVLLEGDTMVGQGLALIATPGHTEGNHSIVTHAGEGLYVTSENGIGPEAYAPEHSEIPGVQAFARDVGAEFVLNGNTLEGSVDQYISMAQEKAIAGPSKRDPRFPNMLCSSELAAWWAFPGIRPTFAFGDVEYGTPARG